MTDHARWTRFGVFEFDPVTGDVWKGGRCTRLTEQPRQALEMLVERPGELVTRDELRAALWPRDTFVDFDTGLNVVINKIRNVLGDSASEPRFIETLPRRGYRFVAPVTRAADSAAQASEPSLARYPRKRAAGMVLVVICLLAILIWRMQPDRVPPGRTVSPAAREAYLRGRYLLAGLHESPTNTADALREFRRSVQVDPLYAEAYVGIAEAEQVQATFQGGHATLERRRLAFAAASRALELDPRLGDAYAVLARVQLSEFDWNGARASFARMRELSPNNAPGLVWYAYSLLLDRRFDEAIEIARRAEAVDPLNLNTRVRVAFVLGFAGHNAESIAKYRDVLALDRGNLMAGSFLVLGLLRDGKNEEAVVAANELLARYGRLPLVLNNMALAEGRSGRPAEALRLVTELVEASRHGYVSPTHIAFAYAAAGDRRRALEWFGRAYEERSNAMLFFTVDSLFSWPDDPVYTALVRKIKAPHTVR